jgi:hypothetical protein
MTFDANIKALATRLATTDKDLYGRVAAIINDGQASLGSTYSSSQIIQLVATLKNEILGGAGPAYDTLQELKALLDAEDAADQSAIAAINTALGLRVRVDAAQTLTNSQKAQGRDNIGAQSAAEIGPTDTDYVALYESYLNS